tara:strand:- start:317 stop:949 length:633 start_codon:yes stop_codon:yes gene_type:complete
LAKIKFFNKLISNDEILVCDFDGVFVDSLDIKGKAFASLFENNLNSNYEKIFEHHLKNPSLTRNEKISIYYKWSYNKLITDLELQKFLKKFANITLDQILNVKPSQFIISLLKSRISKKNYILTRSCHEEVFNYIKEHDLFRFIELILDNKYNKKEGLLKIANINKVNPQNIVFIGDSYFDKKAADEIGCKFIFYKVGELKEVFFNNQNI